MNIFAGSITYSGEIHDLKSIPFHFVIQSVGDSVHRIFAYGETDIESSKWMVDFLTSRINGKILAQDISITTEDKIALMHLDQRNGLYNKKTIEGVSVDVENVLQSFSLEEREKIIAIREAEMSEDFKNRVIRVDFLN